MRRFIIALAFLTLGMTGANAQTAQNSTATNQVNVTALAGGSGGGGRQDIHYSGTALMGGAGIPASNYISTANPCAIGAGGSAAGPFGGLSFNMAQSDKDCVARADAGALYTMHMVPAAVSRLCEQRKVADSIFAAYGAACFGHQTEKRYAHATTVMVTILSRDGDINKADVGIYPIGYQFAQAGQMTTPNNGVVLPAAVKDDD